MPQPNDAGSRENEDVRRVSGELAGRLATLGIRVTGTETAEQLLSMVEAVKRFEAAVQARGGDLMVDEGPRGQTTEPDGRHFALPVRREHESGGGGRVRGAAPAPHHPPHTVRHLPPRAD